MAYQNLYKSGMAVSQEVAWPGMSVPEELAKGILIGGLPRTECKEPG